MTKRKMRKITASIAAFLMVFGYFYPIHSAVPINSAYLVSGADVAEGHIEFYHDQSGRYVRPIIHYISYSVNGTSYPAYCLDEHKPGVSENGSYTVSIDNVVSDNRIWRVLVNGYPYKTPEQIGVVNWQDAYCVTKLALWSVISGYDVYTKYRALDYNGELMVNAIANLTNIGRNGTATYNDPSVTLSKSGDLYTETIGGVKYKVQKYTVTSPYNLQSYDVFSSGFPAGTKILNSSNVEAASFSTNMVKVAVPYSSLNTAINGNIRIENARVKSTPILFGRTPNSNWQNYAITYDPYELTRASSNLSFDTKYSSITINKTDSETGAGISNTKFTLYDSNNTALGTYTTNSQGKITINNLYGNKTYKLKETTANSNYISNSQTQTITLGVEENKTINITNTVKKGQIKIVKVDRDNNNLKLQGVKFTIKDNNGNVVDTLTTDKNRGSCI